MDYNTAQPRCIDLPNDAPEGHYWSWRNAPNSIPREYEECMTCGRINASEWLAQEKAKLREAVMEAVGNDDAPFNMPIGEPVSTYSNNLREQIRTNIAKIFDNE